MVTQSTTVSFDTDDDFELTLEENALDNVKPSEQITNLVGTADSCGADVSNAPRSPSQQVTDCLADLAAWPKRRLRQFPSDLSTYRGINCTVKSIGVGAHQGEELLSFNGDRRATIQYPASSLSFGTFQGFDENGDAVNPNFVFDGNKTVIASRNCYGLLPVSYTAPYRIIEVTVVPTGSAITAYVGVIHSTGAVATITVEYEPEQCGSTRVILGCSDTDTILSGGAGGGIDYHGIFTDGRLDDLLDEFDDYEDKRNEDNQSKGYNIWNESFRTEETIVVNGVDIARMTQVTLDTGRGPVTLVFVNPTV